MIVKLTKRGLSALLVLLMVLSMVPVAALADEVADHEHIPVNSERVPPLCDETGLTAGIYCSVCGNTLSGREGIPELGHDIVQYDAKNPTYSGVGWQAYEECSRCGYSTYVEIPKLETPAIVDFDTFIMYLMLLEDIANAYCLENPGNDPVDLVIKYIRTGVDRYNSGSWGIMAGYENADFAKYVAMIEDMANAEAPTVDDMFAITSIKNIECFYLPNGDYVDIGHMFGTMDITYHNNFSQNHADVGGWAGDLVDLLEFADYSGISGTLEEMVDEVTEKCLLKVPEGQVGGFSEQDMFGDLDAMYLMDQLKREGYNYEYETSGLMINIVNYFYQDLSMETRAAYFLNNRLGGLSTRNDIRDAVYQAYTTNKVITTLEGTREFQSADLETLRKAVCYAFADYICELAGDYVDSGENSLYTVFSTEINELAPGINQKTLMATTADGKQIVYYLATADITREDVSLHANYHNNDPTQGWEMQRVLDQALAAEERHSDPNSEHYIENYNVIAAVNGAGFNMSTGEPSGVLVMEGVEYHPITSAGFVGILKDGTPVIGTQEEYNTIYKGQVQEAIACFGSRLIKNGKIVEGLTDERASRTAIGFTKTGKVVLLVLDGRQEPFSAGGGYATLAQILLEAGCVEATNLDGGGSTTFVAQMPGDEELSVVNRPSDGFARSVSTSWILVSTAPSSTAFDHAELETETAYLTSGTQLQVTAVGISPTGNAVELPEGASWAVSDDTKGAITADGLFTAYANGSVEVNLMLDGAIVGSKTLHVVQPDNVYFTKSSIDMVYGESVKLPVKVLYQGKEVAFNQYDVAIKTNNAKIGKVNGLTFTANSDENSGITNGQITAYLVGNPSATATVRVALYKQGELSFDFEQATGGDREFAWHRGVSNAVTDDNSTYIVIDSNEDMVTSYILAIDMNHIPIPGNLEELTYMLPGSDLEGANAWTFLCQLAERISALTEINAVVHYDPNFEIDISQLKVINNYFKLTNAVVDEENCTVTLTLKWIKRSQAINVDTANPMCIVNGITLTPKDGVQWDEKSQLKATLQGEIGYKIYMRASALYSFSSKPENQAYFGLYSYINPEDDYDKGGYFADTYKVFNDSYTLVNRVKEGWYNEDGGFTYYVEGTRVIGVYMVDGLYYNFGETGVLAAKNPYTGLFVENGGTYYAKLGEKATGWHSIGEDWYLFNWQTGVGINGTYNDHINKVDVVYEFENGKLLKGYWHKDEIGLQYFYGPYLYKQGWKTIDGEQYFFEEYYAATGVYPVRAAHATYASWCEFTDTGVLVGDAQEGVYWHEGQKYYVLNARTQFSGLYEFDDAYYYANSNGTLKVDTVSWISYTRGVIPAGTYRFDAEGRILMTTGLVDENGTLYYYKNGARTANAGLVEYNGDIYLVGDGAMVTKNITRWVSKTNGLKPAGEYTFDADGKMVVRNGIIDGYYYVNGVKTSAGMLYIDGNYYFAAASGKLKASESSWCSYNNGLLPSGMYRFAADGKIIMDTELVNEDGTLYYYQNGKRTANAGLAVYEGNIYLIGDGAMVTKNITRWVSRTNGLKPAGEYTFDAEGKMVIYNGIVGNYYYVDGIKTAAGMLHIGEAYYYATNGGLLKKDMVSWCSNKLNNLLPAGMYRFDAEGKIIMAAEVVNEDGVMYYYKDGRRADNAGLILYNGAYYLISSGAMPICNETRYVSRTNGLMPAGEYTFGADGKMVIYNGIVNGYYYVDGIKTAAGMLKIGDNYYFAAAGGKLKTSESSWCSYNNGLLPAGMYRFDAEGKIIMAAELVNEDGTMYYYKDGRRVDNAGLILYNGAYYLISSGAMPICNETRYVSRTNGLMPAGEYTFGADGKMVIYNGIVNGYYYVDGIKTSAGMLKIGGNYYFAAAGGKLKTSESSWCSYNNGLLPAGTYRFDAEGKIIMAAEVVNEDGVMYYYKDGRRVDNAGLILYNGDYYLISSGAMPICNETRYVSRTNGLLPAGEYTFGADGKLIK